MCHESTSFAMAEAVGLGKGTVTLEDFEKADAIFLIGQNPGTNHPRMLTTLRACSERGTKIIAVNPLDERGSRKFAHPQKPLDLVTGGVNLASIHVPVKINGDVAFLKGVSKEILAEVTVEMFGLAFVWSELTIERGVIVLNDVLLRISASNEKWF